MFTKRFRLTTVRKGFSVRFKNTRKIYSTVRLSFFFRFPIKTPTLRTRRLQRFPEKSGAGSAESSWPETAGKQPEPHGVPGHRTRVPRLADMVGSFDRNNGWRGMGTVRNHRVLQKSGDSETPKIKALYWLKIKGRYSAVCVTIEIR